MFTPLQAFKLFFARFSSFQGRSTRSEFWWVMLVFGFLQIILHAMTNVAGSQGLAFLFFLAWIFVWFLTLSLAVRRLHDRNMSGWWLLFGFVPLVGSLFLFVVYCLPSQHKTNSYGADPTVMPWVHYDYYSNGLHKTNGVLN